MTSWNVYIFRVTGHLCGGISPHNGQWRGALMFSLICFWINCWVNNSWGRWFETPVRPLWRHRNVLGPLSWYSANRITVNAVTLQNIDISVYDNSNKTQQIRNSEHDSQGVSYENASWSIGWCHTSVRYVCNSELIITFARVFINHLSRNWFCKCSLLSTAK